MDIKKIHRANLEILRAVKKLCEENDIEYFLDSGTLLGAVRHKGFIPWDDDLDIVMRREEFEKLLKLREKLPGTMKLLLPEDLGAFYDFVPRIIYLPSRRRSEDDEDEMFYGGRLNHLWADIFILDRLPGGILNSLMKLKMKISFGLGMGHRRMIDYNKYSILQKMEIFALAFIGKRIKLDEIFRLQKKWAERYSIHPKKSGKSFFSNYQPDFQYCTVEDEWEEKILLEFEGEYFSCPREYDKILSMLYGDYMTLPPEEKRIPSHSSREIEVFDS